MEPLRNLVNKKCRIDTQIFQSIHAIQKCIPVTKKKKRMNFLNIFLFFRVPFFKHSLCANFFEQRYCTCLTIVNVWLKIRFLCFCDIFDQNKAKIKCKFILQNSSFLLLEVFDAKCSDLERLRG